MKSTINMSAFLNITPEAVDRMPLIPDGDHIYLIRCEEDYWHDKQINGQPWQMTKSSHKGLDGVKKLRTAEDPSYALMMIAQYTQQNTFKIELTSQNRNMVLTHAPTAKYLYNVGSAMHEKLLNLTRKTMYWQFITRENTFVHQSLMLRNKDKLPLRNARNYHH